MVRRKAKKKQEQDSFIIGDNPKHRNHMFKMQANQKKKKEKGKKKEKEKKEKQHTALGVPR